MNSTRKILFAIAVALAAWAFLSARPFAASADAPNHAAAGHVVAPAEAMQRLREGNERWVNTKPANDHKDSARREELARGQHPFAVVLGCADSRVPPELVFDQGLGDLFVIRVAGEVAPPEVIGSIEYAVEHLGCRTVVVLGHERCGAVEAALNASGGAAPEGNIGAMLKDIMPVVEKVDKKSPDPLEVAVRADARNVVETIAARSKLLAEMSHKGDLVITPAEYHLDSGKVEFLQQFEDPSQSH